VMGGHVAHMRVIRKIYKILVEKFERRELE
jgi:hypothetical protein